MLELLIPSDNFHHFSMPIEEYKKRMPNIKITKIKPFKHKNSDVIIKKETESIIEHIKKRKWYCIFLDNTKKQTSTEDFKKEIETLEQQYQNIYFIIGGSYGCDRELLQPYIDTTLSLSPMTLPHGLALTVLLEQLYRVDQIKKNTSYHH